MSDYRVGVVVGSRRRDSFNRRLADAIVKLAPSEFAFKQLQIGDLSLYNQDDDASPAEPVRRLKAGSRSRRAFYWSPLNTTAPCRASSRMHSIMHRVLRPECLGGQTGWGNRRFPGFNWGGSCATASTQLARILDMPTLGQPEAFVKVKEGLFDDGGNIANEDSRKFLQAWMDRYVAWVKKHGGKS